MLWDMIYKAKD